MSRRIAQRQGQDRSPYHRSLASRNPAQASPAPPVSVCIPVRDEERNLRSCIASVASFSEVVVVDSRSADATASIAEQANARVVQFDWDGRFPKKRNWILRNYQFRNPWILFLDADERVTPEFVTEIRQLLPTTSHCGFWISFVNHFLGAKLRHGDTFRKLALFRIGTGEYETFPEESWSDLDMEVHEHPIVRGTVGTIRARLEHCDQKGIKAYIRRHRQYASWEARRYLWLTDADPAAWQVLNKRQQFKYRHLNRAWLPYCYFLLQFIVKRGFLDGHAGRLFAVLKFRYLQDIRRKIRRLGAAGYGERSAG